MLKSIPFLLLSFIILSFTRVMTVIFYYKIRVHLTVRLIMHLINRQTEVVYVGQYPTVFTWSLPLFSLPRVILLWPHLQNAVKSNCQQSHHGARRP